MPLPALETITAIGEQALTVENDAAALDQLVMQMAGTKHKKKARARG